MGQIKLQSTLQETNKSKKNALVRAVLRAKLLNGRRGGTFRQKGLTLLTEYFHELLAIRFNWFRAFGVCLSTMKDVAAP